MPRSLNDALKLASLVNRNVSDWYGGDFYSEEDEAVPDFSDLDKVPGDTHPDMPRSFADVDPDDAAAVRRLFACFAWRRLGHGMEAVRSATQLITGQACLSLHCAAHLPPQERAEAARTIQRVHEKLIEGIVEEDYGSVGHVNPRGAVEVMNYVAEAFAAAPQGPQPPVMLSGVPVHPDALSAVVGLLSPRERAALGSASRALYKLVGEATSFPSDAGFTVGQAVLACFIRPQLEGSSAACFNSGRPWDLSPLGDCATHEPQTLNLHSLKQFARHMGPLCGVPGRLNAAHAEMLAGQYRLAGAMTRPPPSARSTPAARFTSSAPAAACVVREAVCGVGWGCGPSVADAWDLRGGLHAMAEGAEVYALDTPSAGENYEPKMLKMWGSGFKHTSAVYSDTANNLVWASKRCRQNDTGKFKAFRAPEGEGRGEGSRALCNSTDNGQALQYELEGVTGGLKGIHVGGSVVLGFGARGEVAKWDLAEVMPVDKVDKTHGGDAEKVTVSVKPHSASALKVPSLPCGPFDEVFAFPEHRVGGGGLVAATFSGVASMGKAIMSGWANCVATYDLERLSPLRLLAGHMYSITSVKTAVCGGTRLLVTASNDGCVKLWDVRASEGGCRAVMSLTDKLDGHGSCLAACAVAQDKAGGEGCVVFAGGDNEAIRAWDVRAAGRSAQGLYELSTGNLNVTHLAYCDRSSRLFSELRCAYRSLRFGRLAKPEYHLERIPRDGTERFGLNSRGWVGVVKAGGGADGGGGAEAVKEGGGGGGAEEKEEGEERGGAEDSDADEMEEDDGDSADEEDDEDEVKEYDEEGTVYWPNSAKHEVWVFPRPFSLYEHCRIDYSFHPDADPDDFIVTENPFRYEMDFFDY